MTRSDAPAAADAVLAQSPAAGVLVAPGGVVDVTVASGRNAVPNVVGLTVSDATAALQAAGFGVGMPREAGPDAVSYSRPASGTVIAVGTTVDLVVPPGPTVPAEPTPPASPTPTATPSSTPRLTPTATPTPSPPPTEEPRP